MTCITPHKLTNEKVLFSLQTLVDYILNCCNINVFGTGVHLQCSLFKCSESIQSILHCIEIDCNATFYVQLSCVEVKYRLYLFAA